MSIPASLASDLAALYHRDIIRLRQEVEDFPNDASLWQTLPGITNSAGNLVLHLEGNLLHFIAHVLCNHPYQRQRDEEFSLSGLPQQDLLSRIDALLATIPPLIAALSPESLAAIYPEKVFNLHLSNQLFLIHLHGHFTYHTGQIDYLRRIANHSSATPSTAVPFATLQLPHP